MAMKSSSRATCIGRGRAVTVHAAFQKVTTTHAVKAAGGKLVVQIEGQRILIADDGAGVIHAVSNKCPHMGLPLQGKTAFFQGKVKDKCIVCPAHGTAFDLATGKVKGKWCPSLPESAGTGFGLTPQKPLPTFQSRVTESGDVEVDIDPLAEESKLPVWLPASLGVGLSVLLLLWATGSFKTPLE